MIESVLIVEDEALVAVMMEEILAGAGFDVCEVTDRPAEAMQMTLEHSPALAVVDVRLAGGDGIALADELALMGVRGILFVTGNPAEVGRRARSGQGCLAKPFQAEWLVAGLRAVQLGLTREARIPGFFALPVGG